MVHLLISPLLGNTPQNSTSNYSDHFSKRRRVERDESLYEPPKWFLKKKEGVDSTCTTNIEIVSISFSYRSLMKIKPILNKLLVHV